MMRTLGLMCRAFFVLSALMILSLLPANAEKWYQPTSQQLKMTSDPKAPNASAVYLYREETVNDQEHMHTFYAVIKVLAAGGKKWADVQVPYDSSFSSLASIEGRTIEPDGTVVPFKGKPYQKLIFKGMESDGTQAKVMAKVFTLPDVQVGSILEYRYILDYDSSWISAPQWIIQQPLFVHSAHYHFVPSKHYQDYTSTDAQGHQNLANQLLYSGVLPKGVKVRSGLDGYDLVVKNIPALVDEKHEMPMASVSYRLQFYYSPYMTETDFWSHEGKFWSKNVNKFADNSPEIQAALQSIVSQGDSDAVKLQKIYEAVMKLNNTDYTRTHSAAENKAEGVKIKNAGDIWKAKQGNSDELTELFLALVRAAGMKAYAMRVCDRQNEIFEKAYLSWGQLDDDIAIVVVNGKEVYFDPGTRYEDFGELAWYHTMTGGVRQTANGTEIAVTPGDSYKWSVQSRVGTLTIGPDGSISGQVRVIDSGDFSMELRGQALVYGLAKLKQKQQKYWNDMTPAGMSIKVDHFLGLDSTDTTLMEILDVSGTIGTKAGNLRVIPGNLLEAGQKPLFTSPTRKMPIDLGPAYMTQDHVTVTLPANYTMQGLPKNGAFQFLPNTAYRSAYTLKGNTYTYDRLSIVATAEYLATSYPQLKTYFQQVSQADQQPMVFKVGPAPAQASTPAKPVQQAGAK
jgi:hypothetical protein